MGIKEGAEMKKKIIIISSIVAVLAVGGISGAVIYTNSNKDVDTSVNVAENDIDEEDELTEEVTEKEEDTTSDDKKTTEKKTTEEKTTEKNEKNEKTTEKSEKNSDKKETSSTISNPKETEQSVEVVSQPSVSSQSTTTSEATTPATTQAPTTQAPTTQEPTTEHVHNYVASTKTIHHEAVTHWEVHNITNTGFDFEANGLKPWGTFTLSDGSTGGWAEWLYENNLGCAFCERNVEVVDSPAWDETVTVYTCSCGDSYTK